MRQTRSLLALGMLLLAGAQSFGDPPRHEHRGSGHDHHGYPDHGYSSQHWLGGSSLNIQFGTGGFYRYQGPIGGGLYGGPFTPPVYGNSFYGPSSPLLYPGYDSFGYYGPVPGAVPYSSVIPPSPQGLFPGNANPFDNSVMRDSLEEEVLRWGADQLAPPTGPDPVTRLVAPSSNEAKLLSLRFESQGDQSFRDLDFHHAYNRYKSAVNAAEDRPEAHFRLGLSLAALGFYDRGILEFKRAVHLDPALPATGQSLSDLFGAENVIAKDSLLHKVAAWVREDIRSPDRLFLFGLLLHFDGHDGARDVFETAWRLAGKGQHLAAFLTPSSPVGKGAAPQPIPARPRSEPASPPTGDELPPPPPTAPQAGNGPVVDGPRFPVLPGS